MSSNLFILSSPLKHSFGALLLYMLRQRYGSILPFFLSSQNAPSADSTSFDQSQISPSTTVVSTIPASTFCRFHISFFSLNDSYNILSITAKWIGLFRASMVREACEHLFSCLNCSEITGTHGSRELKRLNQLLGDPLTGFTQI